MNSCANIEAIRVKAVLEQQVDKPGAATERPKLIRRFAFDPSITTFKDLMKLLQRAFHKRNLAVSYKSQHHNSTLYFNITCDIDFREAIYSSTDAPFLELKVYATDEDESSDGDRNDWIILEGYNIPEIKDIRAFGNRMALPSAALLRRRVGNTLYQITSAFVDLSRKAPLGEADWVAHQDYEGRMTDLHELWVIVFNFGVEPAMRREVWKHLLNVFPPDLTEMERDQYLMMKSKVYWHIRDLWQRAVELPKTDALRDMVWKDVRRTDRKHAYYDVPDEHERLTSLYNILVTYAISNPDVAYAQGMSDLAAPLLVVMEDEAVTFTCFAALMARCKQHFLPDGKAMSLKFDHLSLLLQKTDPELYRYLVDVEADDMFFCYRWLVLDLKREFEFDEALRVAEVIWSAVLPAAPRNETTPAHCDTAFNTVTKRCGGNSTAVLRSEGYTSLPYAYQAMPECTEEEEAESGEKDQLVNLPDPYHLGEGNPFALFLCLAILVLHRDRMLQEQDYNSLASSFDKLVRKHDADKVLTKARYLYSRYLRHCQTVDNNEFVSQLQARNPALSGSRGNGISGHVESWFDDSSCEFVPIDSKVVAC